VIRRVAALMVLGVRAPLRSRLVAALLVLLAGVVLLLPIAIKGDGTTAGDVRMLLTWTFGIAFGILCLSTIWSGCATVSSDIEQGRHVLTAVSPARSFEIWLGRWLGILVTNAVLLVLVIAAIWIQLRVRGVSAEDTRVYRPLALDAASVTGAVDAIYQDVLRRGLLPPGVSEAEARREIRRDFDQSYLPVEPGQSRAWLFALAPGDGDRDVRGTFSFLSLGGALFACEGRCVVTTASGREVWTAAVGPDAIGRIDFNIPAGRLSGESSVRVTFYNLDSPADGISVLVSHADSMRLLVADGGVLRNLIKSACALLALLALLAAVGVSCGTLFSFPVAAFTGTALVVMMLVAGGGDSDTGGGCGHAHHGEACPDTAWRRGITAASTQIATWMAMPLQPFLDARVVDRLGDGLAIDSRQVWRVVGVTGLAAPFMLGLLAALALRRREYE